MENSKKALLSLKNVEVKFKVRGRQLTAIRGVSMDIYDGETLAIVGESGSGKSVLTKTFSGMLDSNGFISSGSIILNDEEISNTILPMNKATNKLLDIVRKKLDVYSKYENARKYYLDLKSIDDEFNKKCTIDESENEEFEKEIKALNNAYVDTQNDLQVLDRKVDKEEIEKLKIKLSELKKEIDLKTIAHRNLVDVRRRNVLADKEYMDSIRKRKIELNSLIEKEISKPVKKEYLERNEKLAKEILLSSSRYTFKDLFLLSFKLLRCFKKAMMSGADLLNEDEITSVFDKVNFRVQYEETLEDGALKGHAIIDLAKIKNPMDWQRIRGTRISTVFQDPMTSLNPIITIGNQISNVIMKHQHVSKAEAKEKALEMMRAVGITNPEDRYDDYPFQYSGGMRQRIVIAIALSCAPKILICDEPTTALDVTIQAQILKLIKKLQNEYKFTTIYITHDFGVVANVAERVAVLYAGQVIEYGQVEEIFYDPRHPYTWALLSSLPQLSVIGEELYSIKGTPPSLYNKIKGDAFAPRNPYCMKVDLVAEPPYFKISDTHYAKTWLCDPRAPKVEKPKNIRNLHEQLEKSMYNSKNMNLK